MVESLDLISNEGDRLLALARRNPEQSVPQYPDWTVRDLLSHTGSILGRTVLICRDRLQERPESPRPSYDDDVFAWFEGRLAEVLGILEASEPNTPVWGFGPEPDVGFWTRRMLIEVGIHRWDAEYSFGRPIPLLDEVAEAGLDEFPVMWLPRLEDPVPIRLIATDLGRDWDYGTGEPMHTIDGAGSDLYLRLMSRPSPVDLPEAWAEAVDGLQPPPR